jgi:hypothetical protein
MKRWWCMGCQAEVKLSKHGRCEICDSEAVDSFKGKNNAGSPVAMTDANLNPTSACS